MDVSSHFKYTCVAVENAAEGVNVKSKLDWLVNGKVVISASSVPKNLQPPTVARAVDVIVMYEFIFKVNEPG